MLKGWISWALFSNNVSGIDPLSIILSWHKGVHTQWGKFWCHTWRLSKMVKKIFMDILKVFDDYHMWRQNWPHYLWTSFFMNLLHSPAIWLFVIEHLWLWTLKVMMCLVQNLLALHGAHDHIWLSAGLCATFLILNRSLQKLNCT